MVSFSRSDSRSTMSISCDCSSVSGSSCRRSWIEPDIDASGFRISCAIPAAISPTAASRCWTRASRSALARFGDVTEREQKAVLAAWRPQDRGADPQLNLPAVRTRERELDARQRLAALVRRRTSRRRRGGSCSTVAAGWPTAAAAPIAGDRLGGAVERHDAARCVGRRQAAGQAVDHVLAERLQVGELIGGLLQPRVGPAKTLREIPAEHAPLRRTRRR